MKRNAIPGTSLQPILPLLCSLVAAAALPHAANLPLEVVGFVLLACAWRLAAAHGRARLPGKPLLFLLTLLGSLVIYSHFQRFHGPEAAASLLLTGVGLKLLEMSSRRELSLVIYLASLVTVTAYLFDQGLGMAVYSLALAILLVAALLSMNGGESLKTSARIRFGAVLVLQALPLALALFLFVPRIPGPLWRLPQDDQSAQSGLSDVMEPGAITRLGRSRGTAFRVDFEGPPPPPPERYWRGPVFWHFDGRRWTAGNTDQAFSHPLLRSGDGPLYRYVLMLEPHQRRWVFPLEFPETAPPELELHEDGFLQARAPIRDRKYYALTSRPRMLRGALSPTERARALQLPGIPDPAVQRLIAQWQSRTSDPLGLVSLALGYFHDEPFIYTLQPPAIGGDPVAGFLFETRRGFCEHFTGAFVYLMRVAGVPARVVTGYQGGHWNPVGRFLDVQQADAHAWAEIWLNESGWTRVDPTAAVAPERIQREVAFAGEAADDGRIVFEGPVAEALAQRLTSLRGWMMEAGLLWDSLDHDWHRWVLAYDPDRQRRLLARLGVVDWLGLGYWLFGATALALLLSSAWILRRRPTGDPLLKIYLKVTRHLEQDGLIRRPAEGWQDFALRVAERRPDLAAAFSRFTELFVAIRYGGNPDGDARAQLEHLAKRFPEG